MRVAVHFADDHELAQGEGPAVAAYALGRIEDGVHNAPVGHEPVALDEFLQRLLERAQAEYPDHEVTQDTSVPNRISVERLVWVGEDQGEWIPADAFDPEVHRPVGPGTIYERDLSADASAEGGAA